MEIKIDNNQKGLPHQFLSYWYLTRRHLKVFFKNVPTVIFSLMVPLAIFAVYVVFLRSLEVGVIREQFEAALARNNLADASDAFKEEAMTKLSGIADCWMISGVLGVSCITVSLNTDYIVVRDKETGITRDFISSPIDPRIIVLSYFTFNVIVTFAINFLVYLLCLLYIAISGAYMISFVDFFAILGILLLSVISASLITFFICSFISSESVLSPIVAIVSAAIGFLIGAYLPSGFVDPGIERITVFFPGTYSVSLLRNYFIETPLAKLQDFFMYTDGGKYKPLAILIDELTGQFGFNLDFFGYKVPREIMALVILAFIGIFAALDIFVGYRHFFSIRSRKKEKKKEKKDKNISAD